MSDQDGEEKNSQEFSRNLDAVAWNFNCVSENLLKMKIFFLTKTKQIDSVGG